MAVNAIGTFWLSSERLCAVTSIVSIVSLLVTTTGGAAVPDAAAAKADCENKKTKTLVTPSFNIAIKFARIPPPLPRLVRRFGHGYNVCYL